MELGPPGRPPAPGPLAAGGFFFAGWCRRGKALLLLRSDMMMKYMGLKLGPVLKLTYHIDKLKQGKF